MSVNPEDWSVAIKGGMSFADAHEKFHESYNEEGCPICRDRMKEDVSPDPAPTPMNCYRCSTPLIVSHVCSYCGYQTPDPKVAAVMQRKLADDLPESVKLEARRKIGEQLTKMMPVGVDAGMPTSWELGYARALCEIPGQFSVEMLAECFAKVRRHALARQKPRVDIEELRPILEAYDAVLLSRDHPEWCNAGLDTVEIEKMDHLDDAITSFRLKLTSKPGWQGFKNPPTEQPGA